MKPQKEKTAKVLAHEFDGSREFEDEIEFKGKMIDESIYGVVNRDENKQSLKLL